MRRASACLLACLLSLVVASIALGGRGDPKRAITRADQARAKSMLLRRSDLASGFTAQPSSRNANYYCAAADESDLTVTGDAQSPNFSLQAPGRLFFISSQAQVYTTTAEALTSWRRGTSKAGEECGRKVIGQAFSTSGIRLRSFGRQVFPAVAPLTVAYRVTADLPSSGVRVFIDVVVLQRARAQGEILVFSAGAPLVRSELLTFAHLMSRRMTLAGA